MRWVTDDNPFKGHVGDKATNDILGVSRGHIPGNQVYSGPLYRLVFGYDFRDKIWKMNIKWSGPDLGRLRLPRSEPTSRIPLPAGVALRFNRNAFRGNPEEWRYFCDAIEYTSNFVT